MYFIAAHSGQGAEFTLLRQHHDNQMDHGVTWKFFLGFSSSERPERHLGDLVWKALQTPGQIAVFQLKHRFHWILFQTPFETIILAHHPKHFLWRVPPCYSNKSSPPYPVNDWMERESLSKSKWVNIWVTHKQELHWQGPQGGHHRRGENATQEYRLDSFRTCKIRKGPWHVAYSSPLPEARSYSNL